MKPLRYFVPAAIALIWAIVLATPALRTLFTVQVGGSSLSQTYPWTQRFEKDAFDSARLLARFPDDANVQGALVSAPNSPSEVSSLERALTRFPDQIWIRARYALASLKTFPTDRIGGDFSAAKPPVPGVPSPETNGKKLPFTPAQLNHTMEIIRVGARLEADNAFWDWILVHHLMTARRDVEAYRTLAAASHKARFDDHAMDMARARIAARERVRPLLWEEKMSVMWWGDLFHFNTRGRDLARLLSWQLWKAERRGEHGRAIQGRLDAARLCNLMMKDRNSAIGSMVASAIQAIMWSGNPNRRVRNNQLGAASGTQIIPARARAYAARFAAYVRAHNRPDAAREAVALGEESALLQSTLHANIRANDQVGGVPFSLLSRVFTNWNFGLAALVQVALMALGILLSGALLFGARREAIAGRDAWRHAIPVAMLVAAIGIAAQFFDFSPVLLENYTGSSAPLTDQNRMAMRLLMLFAVAPVILCALFCAGSASGEWRVLKAQTPPSPARYEGESAREMPDSALPVMLRFATWGLFALTSAVLALAVISPGSWAIFLPLIGLEATGEEAVVQIIVIAAVLLGLCYAGWLFKSRFLVSGAARPLAYRALRRHRAALVILLLLSSAFYASSSWLSLRDHAKLESHMETLLQRGEASVQLSS